MNADADAVLEALRAHGPASADRIAERFSLSAEAVRERLAALEDDGQVEREEREGGETRWTTARDPRIEESLDRMTDRLDREPGR